MSKYTNRRNDNQGDSEEAVLSSTALKQHDSASEDNQEWLNSWVFDVNTIPQIQEDLQPSTSGLSSYFNTPTCTLDDTTYRERKPDWEENDSKPDISAHSRHHRLQSLLYEKPSGDKVELKPSRARYNPSTHNDVAFADINLSDLKINKDPETVSSGLSIHEVSARKSVVASVMSRISVIQHKDIVKPKSEQVDEVEPEVSVTQPSADGDEQETNDEVKDTFAAMAGKTARPKTGGKVGGLGAFRGLHGIGKWRVKSKKHGIKGMKAFAKDEPHHRYIVENMDRTAVELPLSMQKLIFEETYQVLRLTVKDYISVLGHKDPLTKCAIEKLDERVHILRMVESL